MSNNLQISSHLTSKGTAGRSSKDESQAPAEKPERKDPNRKLILKRGHALTYAALFLFTIILYARPGEFYPSPLTASIAFITGIITLIVFIPSQLAIEGSITARPREVNLVLLFLLAGLLSIPLAMSPVDAWGTYSSTFIRCIIIFIVMVNVARTKARLMGLLFLALFVSLWLSFGAINDYRLGLAVVEGYRAGGRGSGIFGNSNEMALHLVTIVPIVVALVFATRSIVLKCAYSLCAVVMVAGIVVSYSRGAFIGLLVASALLVWKLGQRRRLMISILAVIAIGLFLLLVPGNYGTRILSIFVPSLDPVGSSEVRRAELLRSLNVSLHHPLFGIGMGNYASQMSLRDVVTHNSYTQVSAEMGLAALVVYTMLVVTPFRRLGQIARETFAARRSSQYFYLAVGLQASLGAYLVASFFASVPYYWYVYYLVGYAVCFRRIYESETGHAVVLEKRNIKKARRSQLRGSSLAGSES